ncbi:MAG: trypsin-like peptidase domain-containing protein [Rhizobacter sp.]|nr:trypsin-like peptidase domain-containing protein [Rhizobacter sp.]
MASRRGPGAGLLQGWWLLLLSGCAAMATPPALTTTVPAPVRVPAVAAPPSFAPTLRRAMPPVVGVYGLHGRSTGRLDEEAPWGSSTSTAVIGAGFFVDDQGHIATAAHVVSDAAKVLVKMSDQRVLEAQVVAHDDTTDIALIVVPLSPTPVPVFGDSTTLRPGDWVLAVGEPYGLARSVVAGIVGGRTRHFGDDHEGLYLQSDLSLNPGNSGGPLLDVQGAVVGMNLRTVVGPYGTSGVSLSIPIETVRQVVAELRDGGTRTRPRLGAGFEDVSPLTAQTAGRLYASGALVTDVEPDSLAAQLGLRVGDIVVGMNGHPLEDSADLARVLLGWRTVEGTSVVVFREGRLALLKLGP